MTRRAPLLILRSLTILPIAFASGCENFTLIKNLNLGPAPVDEGVAGAEEPGAGEPGEVCWPTGKPAVAELKTHGYTPDGWPKMAQWLNDLGTVQDQHPDCDQPI